jgi:hypothetical protein
VKLNGVVVVCGVHDPPGLCVEFVASARACAWQSISLGRGVEGWMGVRQPLLCGVTLCVCDICVSVCSVTLRGWLAVVCPFLLKMRVPFGRGLVVQQCATRLPCMDLFCVPGSWNAARVLLKGPRHCCCCQGCLLALCLLRKVVPVVAVDGHKHRVFGGCTCLQPESICCCGRALPCRCVLQSSHRVASHGRPCLV